MYAILIYFLFRSLDFIAVIARTSRKTPILKIPYAYIYGVAPVSVVLMLISYTYMTVVHTFRGNHTKNSPEEGE